MRENKINRIYDKEIIKQQIKKMEKEIPYLKGNKKVTAKKEYLKLLRLSVGEKELTEPVYIKRK